MLDIFLLKRLAFQNSLDKFLFPLFTPLMMYDMADLRLSIKHSAAFRSSAVSGEMVVTGIQTLRAGLHNYARFFQ